MTVQLEKEELMEENFYPEKQIDEKKYSCQILLEKTTIEQANDKTFPTDARLIWYKVNGIEYIDLTRCRKTVELFDMYYDKFKTGLKMIDYGKGTIKPALWRYNDPKPKTKKRK